MNPTYFDSGMALSFVHRRLFGAAKGALTGGLGGAVGGFLTGDGGAKKPTSEGVSGSPVVPSAVGGAVPGITKFAAGGDADFRCRQRGLQLGASGVCVDPGAILPGGAPFISRAEVVGPPPGVPMIGASATTPLRDTQVVRRCPGKGRVLGADGLCYDSKSIRKDQRMWPPGRKPLLTGGDLNAISRAARAAGRMKTQQKRLQKLGLLPKPKPAQRRLKSGPTEHHHHA